MQNTASPSDATVTQPSDRKATQPTALPGPKSQTANVQTGNTQASSHWQFATWLEATQSPAAAPQKNRQYRRFDRAATAMAPSGLSWSTAVDSSTSSLESPVYIVNADLPSAAPYSGLLYSEDGRLENRGGETSPDQLKEHYRRLITEAAHDVRSPIATASQIISTVTQRARGLGSVTQAELSLLDIANQRLAQASNWAAGILVDRRLEQLSAISIKKRFYPQQWQALMQPLLNSIASDHNVRLLWIGWERSLPRLYLDVNHLSRAILNLVTNAIQASSAGDQIILRIRHQVENLSRLVIQVEDRGRGLNQELLSQVNAPENGGGKTQQAPASAGIGLATCRNLIECLGGSLAARNVQPRGTVFSVTLPIDDLRVAIRGWLMRQASSKRHGDVVDSGSCALFGIRIGPEVSPSQVDQKLQLIASSQEMVHRIGSDRWLLFSTLDEKSLEKLTTLRSEYEECSDDLPFRFFCITKTGVEGGSNAERNVGNLTSAAERLHVAATRALGGTIPLLDNLDADFGHIYNESLIRSKPRPGRYRRQDSPERSQLRRHQTAYERNPSLNAVPNQHLSQELNEIAHGWRRTQERLDKAHRH